MHITAFHAAQCEKAAGSFLATLRSCCLMSSKEGVVYGAHRAISKKQNSATGLETKS